VFVVTVVRGGGGKMKSLFTLKLVLHYAVYLFITICHSAVRGITEYFIFVYSTWRFSGFTPKPI
jgi:hypothetical protein